MPRESESPSAGWREVYHAMGADSGADDRLRADGGRAARDPDRRRDRRASAGRDPERCPDCKARIGTGADDLCCEAYAERLRVADGGRDRDEGRDARDRS